MRGPGPKWHAKHTASLIAAANLQPVVSANAPRAASGTAVGAMAQSTVITWIAPTAAAAALGFMAVMVLA
jgi:hypothetical protein